MEIKRSFVLVVALVVLMTSTVWFRGGTTAHSKEPDNNVVQVANEYLSNNATRLNLRPSQLDLVKVKSSPSAQHVTFQQRLNGLPVYGGVVTVHTDKPGKNVVNVTSRYRGLSSGPSTASAISSDEAVKAAQQRVAREPGIVKAAARSAPVQLRSKAQTEKVIYPKDGKALLAWSVKLPAKAPLGDWEVVVDAASGQVLSISNRLVDESIRLDAPDTSTQGSQPPADPTPTPTPGPLPVTDGPTKSPPAPTDGPGGLPPTAPPLSTATVKAVVVRDWGGCGDLVWGDLNTNWSLYGTTPIFIDYSYAGLCGGGPVTYAGLVASGADVVIVSDSGGGGQQWSADEIAALQQYASEGHNIIGTYVTLQYASADNRGLAPLFGLRSDLTYANPFVTPTYNVTGESDTLFRELGSTYTSSGYPYSQVDTVNGVWDSTDLNGATIVASTSDGQAVVTHYNSGDYKAVYITNMPEYFGGTADKQFIYNAITLAQPVIEGCLAETPHPYSNFYDQTFVINNPDSLATSTRVHFASLETEAQFDFVYIGRDLNADGDLDPDEVVQTLHGNSSFGGRWSAPVPGNSVLVHIVSDDIFIDNGFCIDDTSSLAAASTGSGNVFHPNPVQTSGDYSLADGGDADSSILTAQLAGVTLPGLDGSGHLSGPYVDATANGIPDAYITAPLANNIEGIFTHTRSDDRFEEANVYYHVDATQRYIQSLGFTDANNRQTAVAAHWADFCNAFYSSFDGGLHLGDGATCQVDLAEDGDVVVHEYGHAVMDNVTNWVGLSVSEFWAIHEGFSDYLAGTMFALEGSDPECMGEWAFVVFSDPCLRRLDGTKHYPEDLTGEEHDDGEIISAALWEVRSALGQEVGDTLVLEGLYSLDSVSGFRDYANAILQADQSLYAGANQTTIREIFVARGILDAPGVMLDPDAGPQSSTFDASVVGFLAGEEVGIHWGSDMGPILCTVMVDLNGEGTASPCTVPSDATLGTIYGVFAMGHTSGFMGSDTFTIALLPVIGYTPAAFDVTLNVGQSTTQVLNISNDGGPDSGDLTFSISDVSSGPPPGITAIRGVQGMEKTGSITRQSNKAGSAGQKVTKDTYRYQYVGIAPGASILLYNDEAYQDCAASYADQALQSLGLSYTGYCDDEAGFNAALSSQTWDLVVVNNPNLFFGNWTPVLDYIAAGTGKLLIQPWAPGGSPALFSALEASWQTDISHPWNMYRWEPGHPLFTSPESVLDFSSISNGYGDDGDKVQPTGGGSSVGGFTTTAQANEALITIGNQGRTVLFSFIIAEHTGDVDGDGEADAVELWKNGISMTGDVEWLSESPTGGSLIPGANTNINVTFDAAGLEVGTYYADIIIDHNDGAPNPVVIPVTLTVLEGGAPGEIGVDPTQYDVSLAQGSMTTRILTISNIAALGSNDLNVEISDALASAGITVKPGARDITPPSQPGMRRGTAATAAGGGTGAGAGPKEQPRTAGGPTVVDPIGPILVVHAFSDSAAWSADVVNKLLATGVSPTIDIFDARSATPSLGTLAAYDAVLVASDYPFSDSVALGNNLADYVDGGGAVVRAQFAGGDNTWSLKGRYNTDSYGAWQSTGCGTSGFASLGTVHLPGHPIMSGVTSFDGGSSSYRACGPFTYAPGATVIADWTDGVPLIATNEFSGHRTAEANFYPPSSDVRGDFWNSSTDGADIMANALSWAAGARAPEDAPWLSESPATGMVSPGGSLEVTVTLDATALEPGIHQANIMVSHDGVGPSPFMIPVTLTVSFDTPAIITNGTVTLGIHPEAHLNVPGPTSAGGTSYVGLRYNPTGYEATAPGCLCEGWGAADAITGVTGYANESTDGGANNIAVESFSYDSDSAVSVVNIGSTLQVTHNYHPSVTPSLYEVTVTLTNTSTATIDPRYRRVMDWDVEPTAFSEFVTTKGATANLLYNSNNGFATANPLGGPSDLGYTGQFTDVGPFDHGALFDFGFDALGPGESVTFTIYYGADGTEAGALDALDDVSAEVYSMGQTSTDPTGGTPNTFLFAFSGVGGDVLIDLSPSESIVGQGATTDVDIVVHSSEQPLDAVEVEVLYDPDIVQVVDSDPTTPGVQITPGTIFGSTLLNEVVLDTITGDQVGIIRFAQGLGAGPTLMLEPSSGPAGTMVTASGSGYDPDVEVSLMFDGMEVGSDMPGLDGSMSIGFAVPTVGTGVHTVKAVQSGVAVASKAFTVTAPSLQAPPSGSFVLGTITFEGVALGSSSIHFSFGEAAHDSVDIAVGTIDGSIEVTTGGSLEFIAEPIKGAAGFQLGIQPKVAVVDGSGNIITTDSSTEVILGIVQGTLGSEITCDQTVDGVTRMTVTNGIAAFTGCSIDRHGDFSHGIPFVLEATAVDTVPAETNPFPVHFPGDTDESCRVGVVDFSKVVTHFGKNSSSPDWDAPDNPARAADVNGDNRVSIVDFSIVVNRYGRSCS